MEAAIIGLASVFALGLVACDRAPGSLSLSPKTFATAAVISSAKKPDFATEIKPIFQARCQSCHFAGGQVYDRMPFDQPETITRLGTKLFTRIKDEKERHLIREFLAP
jgi:uncharacterized membrane protein